MDEIHLTAKDFKIEWYSGTGPGGQHRNKHQNCCRITHIETGLTVNGTASRSRVANQRDAFTRLAKLIVARHYAGQSRERFAATDRIRNYHAVRNEVLDHASGERQPYTDVVGKAQIGEMIDARAKAMNSPEPNQ